jgi:hypothetical protein
MSNLRKNETSSTQLREEPFSGLIDLWIVLSAASAGLLTAFGIMAWLALASPPFSAAWWILFLKTLIASSTELRFCLGHRNYLKRMAQEHAPDDPRRWRRGRWDFLLICVITTFKLTMAVKLSDSSAFINAYLGLLLCDLLWLFFEPRVRSLESVSTFAPCRWTWINAGTALLILLGSRLQAFPGIELCALATVWQLAIAALNCLVDLCCSSGPMLRPR